MRPDNPKDIWKEYEKFGIYPLSKRQVLFLVLVCGAIIGCAVFYDRHISKQHQTSNTGTSNRLVTKGNQDVTKMKTQLAYSGVNQSLIVSMRYDAPKRAVVMKVSNAWHYQPYQIRHQAAQRLWQVWANIHSPSDMDRARIKLIDYNGNEVGGSRLVAGSLIWVEK